METDVYEQKVTTMLSDDMTYEKLNEDPLPKYKRNFVSIITRLKDEDKIIDEQYKCMYHTAVNVQRYIVLLKVTSLDNPLTPMVNYTPHGTICRSSRSLTDLLEPVVGTTTRNVNTSTHLASEMACVMIEED